MARQFTFKTTKDTEWVDPVLEAMDKHTRSRFIRDAIIEKVTQNGVTKSHTKGVTRKVTPDHDLFLENGLARIVPTQQSPIEPLDEPEITITQKELSVDELESKLSGMDFS